MNIYTFEGKNLDELKEKTLQELKKEENEVIIKTSEEEVGLFKTKKIKLEVLVKEDILNYLKEFLLNIVEQMGVKANIEAKIREDHFKFSLFSDNNAILIGKGGRTIESLQTILKYTVSNQTHFSIGITVDVEEYKEKQLKRIEILAHNTAPEGWLPADLARCGHVFTIGPHFL
jgi:spoIIIJ-associated protein